MHKQALYPYAVTKPDFSDIGWSFEHHISETNSVTPQFFYIFAGESFRKKSMLEDFRANVLKRS